jgi:hypothetical protein
VRTTARTLSPMKSPASSVAVQPCVSGCSLKRRRGRREKSVCTPHAGHGMLLLLLGYYCSSSCDEFLCSFFSRVISNSMEAFCSEDSLDQDHPVVLPTILWMIAQSPLSDFQVNLPSFAFSVHVWFSFKDSMIDCSAYLVMVMLCSSCRCIIAESWMNWINRP